MSKRLGKPGFCQKLEDSVYVIYKCYAACLLWILCTLSEMKNTELQALCMNFKPCQNQLQNHCHTHAHLTALCSGLPGWAGIKKVKPIWILLKQKTVSGSGISWAVCVCTSLQINNHASTPPLKFFYRPPDDALPAAQPTVSKHWRQNHCQ